MGDGYMCSGCGSWVGNMQVHACMGRFWPAARPASPPIHTQYGGLYDFPHAIPRCKACPKCGGVDLSLWHHAADGAKVERIDVTCRRCHYSWPEAPLDAPKAAP